MTKDLESGESKTLDMSACMGHLLIAALSLDLCVSFHIGYQCLSSHLTIVIN